jgi:hypothetical protein
MSQWFGKQLSIFHWPSFLTHIQWEREHHLLYHEPEHTEEGPVQIQYIKTLLILYWIIKNSGKYYVFGLYPSSCVFLKSVRFIFKG